MEKRIKIGLWLIVAFCAMALPVMAQNREVAAIDTSRLTYVVTGDVRDASTGRRLQYVNVRISGKKFSTVTNADGGFTIKTNEKPQQLVVSHIGYRTQRVSLEEGSTGNVRVRLVPNTVVLEDVVVRRGDPQVILREAIRKIPANYTKDAELYKCFYREVAQKRKHYIYIAEAVTDMYKTPYRYGVGQDRVAIVKGRRLMSPKPSDTLTVKVIGGPVQAVMLDAVKNRDFIFNEEELALYDIQMGDPVMINDRSQYTLILTPQYHVNYALFFGTLYIDRETLAFTRIELSLDMRDRDNATRAILVNKPAGVRFRPREMSLLINYSYDGERSHLSYVRSLFRFNCDWKKRLFATSFTAVNEMVVTDRNDQDVKPFPRRDSFGDRESLYDQSHFFGESDFWKDYNIIKPTESLEDAVDKLKRR